MSDDVLRSEAMAALGEIIAQDIDLPDSVDRHQILIDVVNEAVGLGPLEPLLADPTVTEIMVNRHDEIFVESHGRLLRHARSEEHKSELQSLMRTSFAVFCLKN